MALGLVLCAGLGACGSNVSQVRARAATDLSCSSDIQVAVSGDDTYRARGCGKEATYACRDGTVSGTVCERIIEAKRSK